MFGEFNEATQLKTSLAKYSVEFNDLAVQMRPHRIYVFEAVRQTLYITVCEKVCGQTSVGRPYVAVYYSYGQFEILLIYWFF